jgi:magnesium-dependent phosphatase 1
MPGAGPNPHPNMKQIGWVGTDWATGELYKQGKRRPKSGRPSRWGWGLYVADDPSM